MREELQQQLFEKYPAIFRQKDLSPQQTAMCWGIACDDGWFEIIDALCGWLTTLNKFTGSQVEAVQVKEKFGGLRFYYSVVNCRIKDIVFPAIKEAILFMELYSEQVCEICGKPGEVCLRGSWRKTVCEEHQEEHNYTPMRERYIAEFGDEEE